MSLIDLARSTPEDAVVRLYRLEDSHSSDPRFVACASPVWNGQLSLEVPVEVGETLLAQVGTAESQGGRLVVRAELRS